MVRRTVTDDALEGIDVFARLKVARFVGARAEAQPPAPRAGYVWSDGYWAWRNGQYEWVPGHWDTARAGYTRVPPSSVLDEQGTTLEGGPN